MARQAIRNVQCVIGIYLRNPPIADISLECTAWIMLPAPRNNSALNIACVKRWNMDAMYPNPPSCGFMEVQPPKATIIKPICEIVEKASTRLISDCTQATLAA